MTAFLFFDVLLYAYNMHEHLYCCLGCNKSQDMSE